MAGRVTGDSVEELRGRADIVEVISGYLHLKKAGRIYKGLCCFHQEKTPSFTVDPDKQLYHCFGCRAGGDVFTFLRQVESLSFGEAAEQLAGRFGITLRYEGGQGTGERSRSRLGEACGEAAAFFHDQLLNSDGADPARRYLEGRGFGRDAAESWQIGYAPPGGDVLYRHLASRGFTSKEIVEAGLARVGQGGAHRDYFRGRIVFPVSDLTGKVAGFGARALGDEQPKYLNSPETPVYQKSRLLFGLDRARAAVSSRGLAIVTEGYTDVIALAGAGIVGVVATCGTALTEDHFQLLRRFCDRVILAFDADPAGTVASERSFHLYAETGLEVLVASLPEGHDPADVVGTGGAGAIEAALEDARPLMRFVLEEELARQRLDTPEAKAGALRRATAILSREPRRVARGEHAFWLAGLLGVDSQQVQMEVAEAAGDAPPRPQSTSARIPGFVKVEREALGLLLGSPGLLREQAASLSEDHFTQPEHRVLYRAMIDGGNGASLMTRLPDDDTRKVAAELTLAPASGAGSEEIFARLEEFKVVRRIDHLKGSLGDLDPKSEAYESAYVELMRLEANRRSLRDRHGGP